MTTRSNDLTHHHQSSATARIGLMFEFLFFDSQSSFENPKTRESRKNKIFTKIESFLLTLRIIIVVFSLIANTTTCQATIILKLA